eukprot:scaffold7830_cov376-Prasinococcus_capsulatus_cf.AAC.3
MSLSPKALAALPLRGDPIWLQGAKSFTHLHGVVLVVHRRSRACQVVDTIDLQQQGLRNVL